MDDDRPVRERDEDEEDLIHDLSRRQRDLLIVGWSSFLIAAIGTMFFFAWIDPLALAEVTELPLPIDRMTGYAIGFFFFWAISAASGTLCVYLIRTRHGHPPPGA
jgi:hypothetical protein